MDLSLISFVTFVLSLSSIVDLTLGLAPPRRDLAVPAGLDLLADRSWRNERNYLGRRQVAGSSGKVCVEDDYLVAMQNFKAPVGPTDGGNDADDDGQSIPAATAIATATAKETTITLIETLTATSTTVVPAITVTEKYTSVIPFKQKRDLMPEPTALAALPDTPVIKVLKRQADCNQTSVISKLSSGCSCLPIDTSTTTSTSTLYTTRLFSGLSYAGRSAPATITSGTTTVSEPEFWYSSTPRPSPPPTPSVGTGTPGSNDTFPSYTIPTQPSVSWPNSGVFTAGTVSVGVGLNGTVVSIPGPYTSIDGSTVTIPGTISTVNGSAITVPDVTSTFPGTFLTVNGTEVTISGQSTAATTAQSLSLFPPPANATAIPTLSFPNVTATVTAVSPSMPLSTGAPPPLSTGISPPDSSLPPPAFTNSSSTAVPPPSTGIPPSSANVTASSSPVSSTVPLSTGVPSSPAPNATIPEPSANITLSPPLSTGTSAPPLSNSSVPETAGTVSNTISNSANATITPSPSLPTSIGSFSIPEPTFNISVSRSVIPPPPLSFGPGTRQFVPTTLPDGEVTSVPVPETSSLPFYQNVLTSTFTVNTTITTEITQVVTSVQFFNVTSVWTSTYTLPTVFPEGTGPGSLYSVTPPMTTVTGTSIFPMSSSSAPEVTAVINPPRKEKRVLRVRRVPPRADDEE